jgi:ABC-2 type transport system permease protein
MKWHRIYAIILRHVYNFRRNPDHWTDSFYWPVIDIVLWGFTSTFIQRQGSQIPNLLLLLMTALILWNVIWRGQREITGNILEEMWARNIVNLFSSPLKISEWIVSVMILSIMKLVITEAFAITVVYILYATNILNFGWYFIPFVASLIITGWTIGFFIAGLLVGYGTKIQTLAWSGAFLLAPFSGVYYPVSTLPDWAQKISFFLPSRYVFEGMRQILFNKHFSLSDLATSFFLNGIYFIGALAFFIFMFNKSKNKGLGRLE